MSGKLFVITAPSGAGKTSLIDAVMRDDPSLKISVSYTTRAPRKGEKSGADYHFVDEPTFRRMQSRGEFLESQWASLLLQPVCGDAARPVEIESEIAAEKTRWLQAA